LAEKGASGFEFGAIALQLTYRSFCDINKCRCIFSKYYGCRPMWSLTRRISYGLYYQVFPVLIFLESGDEQ
ncbi:MAG: hypothetical protein ACD_17C00030G0001, partial [uncultured bacterium]